MCFAFENPIVYENMSNLEMYMKTKRDDYIHIKLCQLLFSDSWSQGVEQETAFPVNRFVFIVIYFCFPFHFLPSKWLSEKHANLSNLPNTPEDFFGLKFGKANPFDILYILIIKSPELLYFLCICWTKTIWGVERIWYTQFFSLPFL